MLTEDTDALLRGLRRLGPVRAPVMVGDRVHDVEGAAEHGVPCIGVLWGYGSREELVGAAALIERPEELLTWC